MRNILNYYVTLSTYLFKKIILVSLPYFNFQITLTAAAE
jgi:hypothetical protein